MTSEVCGMWHVGCGVWGVGCGVRRETWDVGCCLHGMRQRFDVRGKRLCAVCVARRGAREMNIDLQPFPFGCY